MKHDREFWTRHVKDWRRSGLTQAQYCGRHRLLKGTLGYWASTLNKPKAAGTALVEVGRRTEVKTEERHSPIELVVERRYMLRLWPGMDSAHLREVLSVLEHSS
jgi:hypothetical protein